MHVTVFDFILCAFAFTLIISASAASALLGIAPISVHFLGSYHVLVDFFSFLLFYGLFSSLIVNACLQAVPLKTGEFLMNDKNFAYWKFLVMVSFTGRTFLTPLTLLAARPFVLKLFGAKIGSDIGIGGFVDCPFLVSIDSGCALGNGSQISTSVSINDRILIGEVKIGKNVTIGMNSVILPNVEIGDNAIVEIASVVLPGSRIPSGERWRGNPARKWMLN